MKIHHFLAIAVLVLSATFTGAWQQADAQTPPSPPTELEGNYSFTDQEVELRWHEPSSPVPPSSYKIYRRAESEPSFQVIATANDRRYDDDSFVNGTLYYYYVTAMYGNGAESSPSNTVHVTAGDSGGGGGGGGNGAVNEPRNLMGSFDDRGVVELDWFAPDSGSSPMFYRIYRSSGADTTFTLHGLADEPEFDDSLIALSTLYRYVVTAVYSGIVESDRSNMVSVFTHPDSLEDSSRSAVRIISSPVWGASVGQLYTYQPHVVTVPAGLNVCFMLNQGPVGMTIDAATGLLQWTPSSAGIFEVSLKARTCSGPEGEAEQEFHIVVLPGPIEGAGSIHGTIQNLAGAALPAIKVKLFDVSSGLFVMRDFTGLDGSYSFPVVNPGNYYLKADPEGDVYEDQWFDGVKHIGNAMRLVVANGASLTADFTLLREDEDDDDDHGELHTVSGVVQDSSGNGIAGARVVVFQVEDSRSGDDHFDDDHSGRRIIRVVETNGDGSYQLQLNHGHYSVAASASGFRMQFWNHRTSILDADKLHLEGDTTGINFDLLPISNANGAIAGTITRRSDGEGLRSLVVAFRKNDPPPTGFIATTHSDSAGSYLLNGLTDGEYIVLALAERSHHPTFYNLSGGTPFADSAEAVTIAGSLVMGIDIAVFDDSIRGLNGIAGMVRLNNIPAGGVLVAISSPQTGRVLATATSEPDGYYATRGLAPGSYMATFQKPGSRTARMPVSVSYINGTPATVQANASLVSGGGAGSIVMNLRRSWNLVSLPVDVADVRLSTLFPNAVSAAFRFADAGGYEPSDSLDDVHGYWVKFPSMEATGITGTVRTSQTLQLHEGWNLIGSVSEAIDVSVVYTQPSGLITSGFWGYSQGYFLATTVEPGKGYWVRSTGSGTMTISSQATTAKSTGAIALESLLNSALHKLTIADGNGSSQSLYFGRKLPGVNDASLALPPPAPEGNFDVRFASDRLAETVSSLPTARYPISITGSSGAVTLSWDIKGSDRCRYALVDGKGQTIAGASGMSGSGNVRLPENISGQVTLVVQQTELPKTFALHQNYPNPFNPVTTIGFDLPEDAKVTLSVFNILGQKVSEPLSSVEYASGSHAVQFDGAPLASGVYFYKLTANERTDVKRFALMK